MLSLTDDIKPIRDDAAPGYSYVEELGVFVHDMFALLVKEIQDELADPAFQKYRHARCRTNNRGCSGPMCRWARRTWQHANIAERRRLQGKTYKPRPSLERILTEELFQLWDGYIERIWQAQQTKLELEREIQKVISQPDPEPLGNLQTAEFQDRPVLFAVLI